jgi:hypothetical protein
MMASEYLRAGLKKPEKMYSIDEITEIIFEMEIPIDVKYFFIQIVHILQKKNMVEY